MNPTDLLSANLIDDEPLLDSAAQLEQSARTLDLEDWVVQRLKHPERELTIHLPLRCDSGDSLTIAGLRVQHFRPRAGCLGPVLLAPDAHLQLLRPLALQMTLQCALLDLPLGGSAGAIVCDPAQLTESELRHLIRHYLAALDTRGDIFAPTEFIAAWTAAGRHLGYAALVAKPSVLDGLPDPATAIAAGWFTLIAEALSGTQPQLPATSYRLPNCRIAMQGFSHSAAALAKMLHGAGARIMALADKSGGLFAGHGLDLPVVTAHVSDHGMLYGCDVAEPVSNAEVLELVCDVLITAAAERQITSQNAARIHASLVVEAVPNSVTPAAAAILSSRGITVIPALLAAAPRTLAWFAEWQAGLRYSAPEQAATESFVRHKLADVLRSALASAVANKISLPEACRRLALDKLSARWRLIS